MSCYCHLLPFLPSDLVKQNAKSDQKILALIKKNSKVTIREICNSTGLSESGVKKIIKKLKEEGMLVRVGALKGGYWEVP